MTKFILRWVINAVAIGLAIQFVDGIKLGAGTDQGRVIGILVLALIFGLVNAFLGPILKLLTCPLIILTLGLFTLVINTFLLLLTAQIGHFFGIPLKIEGFGSALLGAIIISVVSVVLSLILKDELQGSRRGH